MNAPQTWQRMVDVAFQGLPFARVYPDDVFTCSPSMKDRPEHLKRVFVVIAKAVVKLKLSKCSFALSEVRLLGRIPTASGIAADPEKIVDIKDALVPKTITELRSFPGLAGYYP